ncbi:MAG: acyltransferase family protein [Alphaproteobacteria bacterium]|nr:acyltransferase family protein [Alphaproteobacteria bacterium]
MHSSQATRFHYIDHMRGFIIALVVLQHAVQGYAEQWGGRFWFIELPERTRAFDMLFMWTDGFIMQAMFFLAGMFVLPSLNTRGWWSFLKEKFIRLFMPMIVGVAVLVPPLRYFRYEDMEEPGIPYLTYWWDVYLRPENISPAGFWFLAVLLLLTFAICAIDRFIPPLTKSIAHMTAWLAKSPYTGYLVIAVVTALLIGVSDLYWGTPWWTGLGHWFSSDSHSWTDTFLKLFSARANMFLSYILFFLLGVGVAKSEILRQTNLMEKASAHWIKWVLWTAFLSVLYAAYNYTYQFTGAFSDELRIYLARGGDLSTAWPLILEITPAILVRTTLHGFLCTAQIFTFLILFYRFTHSPDGSKDYTRWGSLGACSYGIFFLHEPIVVFMQNSLSSYGVSPEIKMSLTFATALTISWLTTAYVLRRAPVLKRVF